MLSNLWSDIRYSVRTVFTRPTFAAVIVRTLAFGIGVNFASFSLAEQIVLHLLPAPEPDRPLNLIESRPKTVGRMNSGLHPPVPPSASGGPERVVSDSIFRDLERAREPHRPGSDLGAAYAPVRRAERVDPRGVLRHEQRGTFFTHRHRTV